MQDRIEQHREVLDAISSPTFFPKKTTLTEGIELFDKHLNNKLKLDCRQEAYALKCMFLHVTSMSFQVKSGVKLKPGTFASCEKFRDREKDQDNFLCKIKSSPSFQKFKANHASPSQKRLVLPLSWTTPRPESFSTPASDPQSAVFSEPPESLQKVVVSQTETSSEKVAGSQYVILKDTSFGLLHIPRPPLVWQLELGKQRGPPRDFKLLLQQELAKLRPCEPASSSSKKSDLVSSSSPVLISLHSASSQPASSSQQKSAPTKRFLYSWDHFHGQGRRLDIESGEVEMAAAAPGEDSVLHCKFSCGYDLNTGVPALAVTSAEALVAAAKPRKDKKGKAKAKAKAAAKAKAKAQGEAAPAAKAKAKAQVVPVAKDAVKAKGKAKAEGKAQAKAKAKAKAKAMAAPGMSLEQMAAVYSGDFKKIGDWILVEKVRSARDKQAGEVYFEYISPEGARHRSKSQAMTHGFVQP